MWQIVSNALERSMKTARVISLVGLSLFSEMYFRRCRMGCIVECFFLNPIFEKNLLNSSAIVVPQ